MPFEKDRDRVLSLQAALVAALSVAAFIAAKSTRDALFLAWFPATDLPKVMMAADVLSALVALGVVRAFAHTPPGRAVPVLFALHAALFVAAWALGSAFPRGVAVLTYLHTSALGGSVLSAFWSVMNEWFDPHAAKRWFGLIGSGASAGAVAGGVLTWGAAPHLAVLDLLLPIAAAYLVCAAALSALQRRAAPPRSTPDHPAPAKPPAAEQNAYLWMLAGFVGLVSCADTFIEFSFKALTARHLDAGPRLLAFFALFHAAVGVVTLAIQALATRAVLARFGLAAAASSLPAVTAAACAAALALPGLLSIAILRLASLVGASSIFRAAYELAYTPVPVEKKRASKTLIDVGIARAASLIGSALCALFVIALGGLATAAAVAGALTCSLAAIALGPGLHRGYVRTLTDNLKAGAVKLADVDLFDATTRQTVAHTLGLDRKELLAQAEAWWRDHGSPNPAPPAATSDETRARAALLARRPLDPDLQRATVSLLAEDTWLPLALQALRNTADEATAVLAQALSNSTEPLAVRRRIPRVLRAATKQPAADALVRGLSDPEFQVRHRCAVALVQLRDAQPTLHIDPQALFDAATRETTAEAPSAPTQNDAEDRDEHDERPTVVTEAIRNKLDRRVAYVFTILGLVLDREPLRLALAAITGEDRALRGTGLEYLDSVLPDGLRRSLGPLLEDRDVVRRSVRSKEKIVEELLRSRDALEGGGRGRDGFR